MTEWVEQWICIRFCIKLQHSFMETIWMIQKATAVDNWWLAASSWQCACSCIMSHVDFLAKHQITQVTKPPYSPYLAPCDFWLFPKLKSPLKKINFRLLMRFRKIWWSSWWQLGELCEVPRCPLWRGLRHHCPMFSVSCILFNKRLYFPCYVAGYFLDKPRKAEPGTWAASRSKIKLSKWLFSNSESFPKFGVIYYSLNTISWIAIQVEGVLSFCKSGS